MKMRSNIVFSEVQNVGDNFYAARNVDPDINF